MLVFERKENWSTRRKTSWSKDDNQQQTQPTYDASPARGIQPGPHWWELSALITAPSLLPKSVVNKTYLVNIAGHNTAIKKLFQPALWVAIGWQGVDRRHNRLLKMK